MKKKVRKKQIQEQNVWEASLDRIRYCYKYYDKVVISFSGGKDSTAVLNASLVVAKEFNKLPLEVVFFDEEAIHPTTIEYVQRVANLEEVNLKWYCLPFKHRNACSNEQPYWYTWNPEKEDKWVRPMPKNAITEHKHFRQGMTFQEFAPYLYDRTEGRIAMLTGIRTQESLRRYQVIASKKNEHFLNTKAEKGLNQYRAFPIYDWSSNDVWFAVAKFGWDYNKTYDIYNQTKMHGNFLQQRVCPPYGEEPLRGLWLYAQCFPEMWHKMLNRVEGVATAWRYGNSALYSNSKTKPDHLTWEEYIKVIIDSYDIDSQNEVKKTLNRYIKSHFRRTKQPIDMEIPHPITGVCWQWLCKVAIRGDFKSRQSNTLNTYAIKTREKLGITLEEAIEKYS